MLKQFFHSLLGTTPVDFIDKPSEPKPKYSPEEIQKSAESLQFLLKVLEKYPYFTWEYRWQGRYSHKSVPFNLYISSVIKNCKSEQTLNIENYQPMSSLTDDDAIYLYNVAVDDPINQEKKLTEERKLTKFENFKKEILNQP